MNRAPGKRTGWLEIIGAPGVTYFTKWALDYTQNMRVYIMYNDNIKKSHYSQTAPDIGVDAWYALRSTADAPTDQPG